MNHKKFNLNLSVLSLILFFTAALTMLAAGVNIHKVNSCIQEQSQIEANSRECELQSQALSNASDYLTNEVWHFIATQKPEHMENYWKEVNITKNRERAADALIQLSLTPKEEALINAAKKESDNLIKGEAWAMKLTADAQGLSSSSLPKEINQISLSKEEQELSPEQKQSLALNYIFGEEYNTSKIIISSNLSEFRHLLQNRKEKELNAAIIKTQNAIKNSQLCNVAMLFYLLLAMILYHALAVRPFLKYSFSLKNLKEHDICPLIPTGSRETIKFANAFNKIYSDWEEQKERLEEERLRFHVAVENSHVIIYEYLPDCDEYTAYGTLNIGEVSPDHLKNPRMERTIPHFFEDYLKNILDNKNMEILKELLEKKGGTIQLQILTRQQKPLWIKLTSTPLFDEKNKIIKFIGKITNIQSEKEKEDALENAKNQDGLTGLFNKEPGLRKIQQYMNCKSPEQICCIMILDMDNFSRMNETEGTVFADAILQDVAKILISYTGPEDILVRLGGDEFLLFIKDCPKSKATILGPQIADSIKKLTPNEVTSISASIGMCVSEVVDEYSGLYRCAESTLKYVKNNGKGQAACYLDTSNELGMLLTQMYPDRHPINKIDRPDSCCEDLISFALDLLGKSKKLSDAISLLLARTGRQYDMERISIIDINTDYLSCHVTYQWSVKQSDNHTEETYYIGKKDLQNIIQSYDQDGLCDKYMIKLFEEKKSILHAAIWDHGNYSGFMSFERKEPDYLWTSEERRLLGELVRIISSFFLKAKADAVSQAKTDFLSRMSHEIRTPMNAITGMTSIAKTSLNNPVRTLDCLNKIESATSYLLSLINDILDMSRIESGKLELSLSCVDLAAQLENLGTLLQPQAEEKNLELKISSNFPGAVHIMADELHLNQILINLLGNAIKFTPDGGRVLLNAEIISQDKQNTTIRFSVKDNGIGIEPEAQNRIFNAFEQASSSTVSSYGGTGLGLSISSHLVQMMGGSLLVESIPEKGSDFYFTLCFKNAFEEPFQLNDTDLSLNDSDYNPNGKRILLVEDNNLNLEIAKEILTIHGFLVETATNGSEAVEQFQKNVPYWYHAVLMDIRMPVMDGMEATRKIRTLGKKDSRSIPIIAMTANAFDEDMKRSLENGMNGHLTKPIEVDKLLEMLKKCILQSARENKE